MKIKKSVVVALLLLAYSAGWAQGFTFEAIKSYPFPTELTSSSQGSRIAWALEEGGRRNVYVAEGPDFKPRKLTSYNQDDGQEITSLSISADGKWIVFVRGGDHGSNWDDGLPVNPAFGSSPSKISLNSVPFAGGDVKILAEGGDAPAISPKSDRVVFIKGNQAWTIPLDGSTEAKNLFTTRGTVNSLEWSPDGSKLAFVSSRGDHSFIGVFTPTAIGPETPLQWIAPSFSYDESPQWSPDGTRLAFIRTRGAGGVPDSVLSRSTYPWTIWTADVRSAKATQLWKSPTTLAGSYPSTQGGTNLHWAAGERITFLSYQDGWPHLYSIASQGGNALLLTPGNFMAEYIKISPDNKWLVFCANTGPDKLDIDRRHVVRVPVDKAAMEVLTPGAGLEWRPAVLGDGSNIVCISATAQRPPLPTIINLTAKPMIKLIGQELIPKEFPEKSLVIPKQVLFKSPDGFTIHCQLFEPANATAKHPAIVYVHGGPPRQMQLGWNYSDYYSNAYASNQYLASLGFSVLVVNYRLGIGYGYEFHNPKNAGRSGASEYIDVKAAGEWLAAQPNIDASKIGIYGGSYGGFLTAMALGKDSKLFAAGVDIHGVHDLSIERVRSVVSPDRFERAPDSEKVPKVFWESSPTAYVSTWTSPVLIIHGDDDRNVRFSQSTDLVNRLEQKGVSIETLVIVDDTHHWMKQSNAIKVYGATAEYFVRKLMKK